MDAVLESRDLRFLGTIEYPPISVERGKITFICGESGCGKSSLLKLFNGTVSPSEGEILYSGQPLNAIDSVRLRQEVLLASQTVFLFDGSIEDNFRQFYAYRDLPAPDAAAMQEFLSVCCADFDRSYACERMSGGERQRVFIAICLSLMPRVLLLDEPTSALDELTAVQFFGNIKDYCNLHGITLISVSHDKSLANRFADCVIALEKRNPA